MRLLKKARHFNNHTLTCYFTPVVEAEKSLRVGANGTLTS
jgi:hypothetical protein